MNRWWHEAALYQVYPRSFQDSGGDGVGDLAGICQRLDHIADLGVGAVWLSPIFRSPMTDFGYDVSDYRAIDPLFGDMAMFDRLLAETHARGLKLLLDFVPIVLVEPGQIHWSGRFASSVSIFSRFARYRHRGALG